jgi:hypothetical protein
VEDLLLLKVESLPSVGVHACNPSAQEAEAGGPCDGGHPGMYSEFQAKISFIVSVCLKKKSWNTIKK